MTTSAQWQKQADQLTLTGEVDFTNVVALLREAETWLKQSTSAKCTLDFSGVVNSNSAGIALIMGLHRRASVLSKHLTLEGVPANLISMARLGGLDWLLDNPGGEIRREVAAS